MFQLTGYKVPPPLRSVCTYTEALDGEAAHPMGLLGCTQGQDREKWPRRSQWGRKVAVLMESFPELFVLS